jgi:hypothetical protein
VIECRQRAHSADHDRHRVGVTAEAAEELVELVVQHGVTTDRPVKLFDFLGVRKFTILQQIGHFDEAGVVGQLINRIAAIKKRAFIAVDIGDLAFARRGGRETGVKGENTRIFVERTNVDDVRTDGAAIHRQVISLAVNRQLCGTFRLNLVFHNSNPFSMGHDERGL